MLTKGAIGNLVNRYRAVLKKCNLINTFGSLAVASMLVLGGAGVAEADETASVTLDKSTTIQGISVPNASITYNPDYCYTELNGFDLTVTNRNSADVNKVWSNHDIHIHNKNNAFIIDTKKQGSLILDSNTTHGIALVKSNLKIDVAHAQIDGWTPIYVQDSKLDIIAKTITVGSSFNDNAILYSGDSSTGSAVTLNASENISIKGLSGIAAMAGDNSLNITSTGGSIDIQGKTEVGAEPNAWENVGIYANNSTKIAVNLKAEDVQVSGGRYSAYAGNNASNNIVFEADNATLNGNVLGSKGQINIVADKDVVVNGNVESRSGEGAGYLPYVGIKAGGDIEINGSLVAHWAQGNEDHEYGLEIDGKNVTVNSGDNRLLYAGAGKANIVAEKKLNLIGHDGLENEGGAIKVSADEINITAEQYAVISHQGNIEITPTVSSNIIGDIWVTNVYEKDTPTVNIDLGEGGSLTGGVINDHTGEGSGVYLDLGTGTWNATKTSNVTELTLDNATVNVGAGADVDVDTLKGKGGNINMVDAESSFTAKSDDASEASFKVQAIDADGNVLNADGVSSATLAAMMANVDVTDAEGNVAATSASADNGIVNNGFTITTGEDGKPVVSGGGASSVTKAVLEAASVNTVALDRILTNDVRKRLGDIRSDANKTGVWMRWDGGKLQGEGLTNNFNTIQIGGDTKVAKNCRLGVAGSFTHGDGDFARGSSELEGFSFAAYATWMGENGMFADIVARLGHFSTEVNVEGQSGDMNNRVASLSGEYGWRFNLCEQFFIEPQVELAYTYVSSEDLELETAKFSFDNVDSLTGRVGLVAGWNLPDDRGNVYARASVVQQFMGDAKVTGYSGVAPTVHETDGDDTWLEYGIGANVKLTDKTYIWADVERTEGADIDEEWRGTVGIRYSF